LGSSFLSDAIYIYKKKVRISFLRLETATRVAPVGLVATGLTAAGAGFGFVATGAAVVLVGALGAAVVATGLGLAATAVPSLPPDEVRLSTALYSTAGLACKS
jgi:hypothetical protein